MACCQDVSDGSSKGGAAPAEMETEPSVGAVGGDEPWENATHCLPRRLQIECKKMVEKHHKIPLNFVGDCCMLLLVDGSFMDFFNL